MFSQIFAYLQPNTY